MSFLNTSEIASAVNRLAQDYPDAATLLTLPHQTHEGRSVTALHIHAGPGSDRPCAVFVGGIHAREWIPPDALVYFAADLLEANASGTGLRYGEPGYALSAADLKSTIESLDVVILPCANPDGRIHSQTVDPDWRKNRAPNPGAGPCRGVDLNRNFDVLWDFQRHFAAGHVSASSDPCHKYLYVGRQAASEPETRNVVALLDLFPRTSWYIDVHSAVPAIFYTWGIDENQSETPAENFRNAAFDGLRGKAADEYGEFIDAGDLAVARNLASEMRSAITKVSGDQYEVMQSYSLYATSGASDDYAFSRHFVDGARNKILSFTMECGHEFQPEWAVAKGVMLEVGGALAAFLSTASRAHLASG